jgi:hypothetical protein
MFVVRVELKDVPESKANEVYEKLHDAMAAAGYSKRIKGGNQKWYKLPDATYVTYKQDEIANIREEVKAITETTKHRAGIIVFDSKENAHWSGLEEIRMPSLFANA